MSELRYLDEGSPLAQFVASVRNLVTCKPLLASLEIQFKGWGMFQNDLAMAFDGAPMGIRSPWVRRIFMPVLEAQRLLSTDEDDVVKAKAALVALDNLRNADDVLYRTCRAWVEERFLKPKETPDAQSN